MFYNPRAYSTYDEAIQWEVYYPLSDGGKLSMDQVLTEFDVEAIAEASIACTDSVSRLRGYYCKVSPEEFWALAQRHAKDVA